MRVYSRPIRFESRDEATIIDLTRAGGVRGQEWARSQSVSGAVSTVHGANYGYSQWGRAPAPVQPAEERLRALVDNSIVDRFIADLWRIGTGRLWIAVQSGQERWAWARVGDNFLDTTITVSDVEYTPLSIPFTRLSDWYAAEPSVASRTGNGSLTIDTDGTVETRNITVTLTAHSSGGWSNPSIVNTSSAEQVSINRTATAGEMLRLNVLGFRLERSTDNGSSWQDDTQNLMLGTTQVSPLSLMPGGNIINVSGVPNGTVELSWHDSWR